MVFVLRTLKFKNVKIKLKKEQNKIKQQQQKILPLSFEQTVP